MSSIRRPVDRTAPLEKRASLDPFDPRIAFVPVLSWVWLLLLASIVIVLVLWGFFGTMTRTVEQAGILSLRESPPAAITYVSLARARELSPGMQAHILAQDSDTAITGLVTRVALSGVTPEQAAAVTGSFFASSPVYEVRVVTDWANFADGTPCIITIITGEEHPISRVLPIFS